MRGEATGLPGLRTVNLNPSSCQRRDGLKSPSFRRVEDVNNVMVMPGGITAWRQSGLPLEPTHNNHP